MWTVVAVLAIWSLLSLGLALLVGGIVGLRDRVLDLEGERVSPVSVPQRLAVPSPIG